MKASLIRTDGCGELITPSNEIDFKIEELQRYVGGYIEVVTLCGDMIMIINENGKCMNMDINPIATFIAHENKSIGVTDYIVGDVVVCHGSLLK